jgi:hypothetical protein
MLNYSRRGWLLSGATALVVCAVVAPGIVSAKTAHVAKAKKSYKVFWHMKLDPGDHGVRIPGDVKAAKPFGNGRVDGQVAATSATFVFTFKGGKIYAVSTGAKFVGHFATGNFKMKRGTGKFKGITGKGKSAVDFSTKPLTATVKGTFKF